MSNTEPKPCALYEKWDKCLGNARGTKLCDTCQDVHPAAAYLWRRDNPGFNDLFAEIDAENEDPKTCVTRRGRYADSQMTADVLDSRKRYKGLCDPENPGMFICNLIPKDAKEDTVCKSCLEAMTKYGRESWFNKDRTVNEDEVRKSFRGNK